VFGLSFPTHVGTLGEDNAIRPPILEVARQLGRHGAVERSLRRARPWPTFACEAENDQFHRLERPACLRAPAMVAHGLGVPTSTSLTAVHWGHSLIGFPKRGAMNRKGNQWQRDTADGPPVEVQSDGPDTERVGQTLVPPAGSAPLG
jgi:hypothetical protein